jgi:hypothetical protein
MDIRNVTQFSNFVEANDLARLDASLQAIVSCMAEYKRGCDCWRREERDAQYSKCVKLYLSTARTIVPRFKNEFLAKTAERQIILYTENGGVIVLLSR